MKVFKFGGASLRDAENIRNVASIINKYQTEQLVVVASAMGKTTNALEEVVNAHFFNTGEAASLLKDIVNDHSKIIRELFDADAAAAVEKDIDEYAVEIYDLLQETPFEQFDYIYDQIVTFGEIASTIILSGYLQKSNIKNTWLDVREVMKTDDAYREAKILWEHTEYLMRQKIPVLLERGIVVTQGFMGFTQEHKTTTLGREGSDFTAAVFGYALNAERVVIWKDVPGIMNADPREFPDAQEISKMSYLEAVEMTFYGAKVIHSKTIKPLQNKQIPLQVRSFINPEPEGTIIAHTYDQDEMPPVMVKKRNQILLRFFTRDFSFMAEETLSFLYGEFAKLRIKINMMQNGAISFFAVFDNRPDKVSILMDHLKDDFEIQVEKGLELLTIRHYNNEVIEKLTKDRDLILEHKGRVVAQYLMNEL